jgi:cellulose synthase (UDP-forming)
MAAGLKLISETDDGLPLWGRLLRFISINLGLLGLIVLITAPMNAGQQAVLTLLGIAAFLLINRFFKSRQASLVLVVMSVSITARYLFWRMSDTIVFEQVFQSILAFGLLAAELYAGILLTLSYIQTAYPLDRKPVPLPADIGLWPTVDVYIPTYNESLDLVRPTVFAAMAMDWPADKLKIWILDDGRRQEFRDFAEEVGCGYIIRPDNKGAKAGNLNHAMRHTTGEHIAIFDCDHAPTRAFLQLTVGWLERDSRIALVQTPHHFYSPDPFERNLARKRQVPNEGLLFYGLTQQGNDMWNAAFFCGSCAVIRRSALMEIGGVPHQTVTEDCHCAFLLQQRGWHTAFLRVPLAAGLATERLALHVGQRMRWARGMLQIMRQENTLLAPGLLLHQRLCYFASGFSFMFALPRIVFLTSPLAFLFFGQSVIAASPLAIIAYAGSHMFHSVATTSRLNGRNRHSFWAEIYEASLAVPLLPVTVLTLWDPRKGKFNVTDKGGTLEQGYLDTKAVTPNLVLLALLLIAFMIGIVGIATTEGLEFQAYLLNTIWCGLCLIPVSASIAVGREREQSRTTARVDADVAVDLHLARGNVIQARSTNISLSGARLAIDRPLGLADGDPVTVVFHSCGDAIELRANVLHWEGADAFLNFNIDSMEEQSRVARLFFGRPDAWLHWDHWPEDRPLHALKDVVMSTAAAVFVKYRFGKVRQITRKAPVAVAARVSDVVAPRGPQAPSVGMRTAERVGAALLVLLTIGGPALAQSAPPAVQLTSPPPALSANPSVTAQPLAAPVAPAVTPAIAPAAPPALAAGLPPGAREQKMTLRQLGAGGPLQMRGTADLQGVLFGLAADEVVTAGRLSVLGGSSPSLISSLSQIAITLNEQTIGTLSLDPTRERFGPIEFDLDPLFFGELNRLNFRFSGRYAVECNDPLSGLLWATVSDLSTVTLRIEKLPQARDLAKLPEPLFDRRQLRGALNLNFVIAESAGPASLRAAAIAASWFAVQADYRGAHFPVSRTPPAQGHAVVMVSGPEALTWLPRLDGPTVAVVPSPTDPFATFLIIAGRTEAELGVAATGLAINRAGFTGSSAVVQQATPSVRAPYDAPHWLPTNGPVRFGALVDRAELQSNGYAPGPVRVPLRTAPDLFTWRNVGLPVQVHYRAPPGPILDISASRLDVSLSGSYLRSFPLADAASWWPIEWARGQLSFLIGGSPEIRTGRVGLPPYLLFGRDELQLRFDLRPMARGDCTAVPGDIRASIEPDSTIDISHAYRFVRMPNIGLFASAGFPFTRLADLSGTAAILPERPTVIETGVFLDVIGDLATIVGLPSTGLTVLTPGALNTAASRDLLVFGSLPRQPALATLLKQGAITVQGDRLIAATPDRLQDLRALLVTNQPDQAERDRVVLALNEAGDGVGAIIGVQSPLQSGHSVVAITGLTPQAMAEMAETLRDPEQSSKIQGDISLQTGGRISAFRAADAYEVGELPLWLRAQLLFGGRPERTGMLLLLTSFLIGIPFFWILRRRAARRLRARMGKP